MFDILDDVWKFIFWFFKALLRGTTPSSMSIKVVPKITYFETFSTKITLARSYKFPVYFEFGSTINTEHLILPWI
jgi:hypothetical protein